MYIWAIAGSVPTISNPGNAPFYTSLLNQFALAGHEVRAAVPLRLGLGKHQVRLPAGLHVSHAGYLPAGRLRVGRFDGRRVAFRSFVSAAHRVFRRESRKPDVIFAHFLLPAGIAAAELAEKTGIPAFCSLGESKCESWFDAMTPNEVMRRIESFECLFPVSQHIASFLHHQCGVDSDRIHVIPNGVDERWFDTGDKIAARAAMHVSAGKKIALFVGSANPRKGVQLLRAASELLPLDWEVWIIGYGHQLSRGSTIRVIGAVPQSKLAPYYRAADVFVLPSAAEGMPNSLLEALACGTKAVVSRIPPVLEILGEDYPFYCDLSPEGIAGVIERAAELCPGGLAIPRPMTLQTRARLMLERMAATCERRA